MNFKKWVKSIQTAGYNGARVQYVIMTSRETDLLCIFAHIFLFITWWLIKCCHFILLHLVFPVGIFSKTEFFKKSSRNSEHKNIRLLQKWKIASRAERKSEKSKLACHSVQERIWIKGSYLSQWLPQGERRPLKEPKSRWIEILGGSQFT